MTRARATAVDAWATLIEGLPQATWIAELATRKLAVAGEPITAQYDAPFVPGPFRRNEVLIPVARPEP